MPPILRAVLFDVGGVLVASPLEALNRYESQLGLSQTGFINRAIGTIKPIRSIWADLECNKITYQEFCTNMTDKIREHIEKHFPGHPAAKKYDASVMIREMEQFSGSQLREKLLACVDELKKQGYVVCVISNNWYSSTDDKNELESRMPQLRSHFDHFIESRVLGIRKPDPEIYKHAVGQLGNDIKPSECLFLDDLGPNLKAAKELGIHTIKVENEDQAVRDLERFLGKKLLPNTYSKL